MERAEGMQIWPPFPFFELSTTDWVHLYPLSAIRKSAKAQDLRLLLRCAESSLTPGARGHLTGGAGKQKEGLPGTPNMAIAS